METILYCIDEQNIDFKQIKEAAKILQSGGLVAFPTETVYGLGANAFDSTAATRIYAAKGRPSDNPLIVHISNRDMLTTLVKEVSPTALKLMDNFWPGPLTIIMKKTEKIPDSVTGGLDSVGIRMPNDKVALALIEEAGIPIAAPSANISSRPSPTTADHVLEDLGGRIDAIVDSGAVSIGLESTIIDVTDEIPVVLRPGYISLAQLAQVVGEVRMDKAILERNTSDLKPKAPGMKYKHYAPRAEMMIIEGEEIDVVDEINRLTLIKQTAGKLVGVIATNATKRLYSADIVLSLGNRNNELDIAKHLFSALRQMDSLGVEYIFSESFNEADMGQAIMNRLLKAAGFNIVYLS